MGKFEEIYSVYDENVDWGSEQARLQSRSICSDLYNQLASKVEMGSLHKLNSDKLTEENRKLRSELEKYRCSNSQRRNEKIVKFLKAAL